MHTIWARGLTGVASHPDSTNKRSQLWIHCTKWWNPQSAPTRLWSGDKMPPEQELRKVEAKVCSNPWAENGYFTVIRSSLDCGPSQWKAPCGSWSLGVFCWLAKCATLKEGHFASDIPWRKRKCFANETGGPFYFAFNKKSFEFWCQIMYIYIFFFTNGAALRGRDVGMLAALEFFHSVTESRDYCSKNPSTFKSLRPFKER